MIKVIIFHSNKISFLPYFCFEIYSRNKEYSFEILYKKALNSYKNNTEPRGSLIKLGKNRNNEDIYILARGKNKEIIEKAIRGYFEILDINTSLLLFDLSSYNNYYFKIAILIEKVGLKTYSKRLNKKGSEKIFLKLTEDINSLKNFNHQTNEI